MVPAHRLLEFALLSYVLIGGTSGLVMIGIGPTRAITGGKD